jgi:uncharacterized protein
MDNLVQTGANGVPMRLKNDTVVNVAQLLKEHVGAARRYTLDLEWFTLDHDMMAKDVHAELRLTRITKGILADGTVSGTALIECARCLEIYEQPFRAAFDQEYRPTIDVRSGLLVEQPEPQEEMGTIDDLHELDLAEPMRQVAILDLPIKPICREDCAGLVEVEVEEYLGDRRLGVLSQLLDDETDDESGH